jgi:ribosomal protein L37AE/L43A
MYLHNKYTTAYYNIVEQAQSRTLDCYTENHHIIPRSLGGSDDPTNLVALTPREHFLCHWLLTKMVSIGDASRKMKWAFRLMSRHGKTSLLSGYARSISGEPLSEEHRTKISQGQMGRVQTAETRAKMSAHWQEFLKDGDPRAHYPHTEETKQHLSAVHKARFAKMSKEERKGNLVWRDWTCEHCGKEGKGGANYKRWHGTNCRTINTVN